MPCYHPLEAWQAKHTNSSGKRSMVFSPSDALDPDNPIDLPCGRCIGCRLEYSRQWAIRCMHEASMYENNCYLTLTYDDEHLPSFGSLDHEDFQKFMKKLRKRFVPVNPFPWSRDQGSEYQKYRRENWIRYYMCGEYGERCFKCNSNVHDCLCKSGFEAALGRPHFHACIFNFDFDDKVPVAQNKNGDLLYASPTLTKMWGKGHANIGQVTFESAAYVARYITKKITGDASHDHYHSFDIYTGESYPVVPEYCRMSRDPGIAKPWYEKYKGDLTKGYITVNGQKVSPAKFYDKQMEKEDPALLDYLKDQRKLKAMSLAHLNTEDRLATKEYIKLKKVKQLKRGLS